MNSLTAGGPKAALQSAGEAAGTSQSSARCQLGEQVVAGQGGCHLQALCWHPTFTDAPVDGN